VNALERAGLTTLRERAVAVYGHGDRTLMVFPDESPESPREWDNLAVFAFKPNHHFAGDLKRGEFTAAVKPKALEGIRDGGGLVLPVYAYVHSGVAFSLSRQYPFDDRWDAGCCGYALATGDRLRKRWRRDANDPRTAARAFVAVRDELRVYEQFLGGEVYGYRVFDRDWKELDACWGYYGDDFAGNGLLESAGFPADAPRKDEWK
jgi:hypothetical protein